MRGLGLSLPAVLDLSRSQLARIIERIRSGSSRLRDWRMGFLYCAGRIYPTQKSRQLPRAPFQRVEEDRAKDHQAGHHFLAVAFDAGEVHAVLNHSDDEHADERAEDAALAAGEAGAADD